MPIPAVLSYVAAYLTLLVTLGVLVRDSRSFVHRAFAAGMLLFALEEVLRGLSYGSVLPEDAIFWQKRVIAASVWLPAVWLAFSLTYARISAQKAFEKWKWPLIASAAIPTGFVGLFRHSLLTGAIYLETADRWSILLGWSGRALQF